MARAKGFAEWKPQKKTLALLSDIDAVLAEYEDYLPLTIRQVFYRLVGKGHPKTENFYATVQEVTSRARRSGRIEFSSIRDDGVSRRGGERLTYETPRDYYKIHETISNFYKRSWHDDQPTFVRLLSEASGMVPMLERAVGQYRIGVASSSGFPRRRCCCMLGTMILPASPSTSRWPRIWRRSARTPALRRSSS
jgi:hypothetical protein